MNQTLLEFQGRKVGSEHVVQVLETLYQTLIDIKKEQFDYRLAEYCFIPISFALKSNQLLTVRASEISFRCLGRLLDIGWREKVAGPLGAQLLILLSITADRSQKVANGKVPSEELLVAVYECFKYLFYNLAQTKAGRQQLLESSSFPHLAHSITVVLDGLGHTQGHETQLTASLALQQILAAVDDRGTTAKFLPGIFSALSKVLTPSSSGRRQWKLLKTCLEVLVLVIVKCLGDESEKAYSKAGLDRDEDQTGILGSSWREATAGQIKIGLASIERLYTHDRTEVKRALLKLNLAVLKDCFGSLSNCHQLCLETTLYLYVAKACTNDEIESVIRAQPDIKNDMEILLRNWTVSMPRILEGSDEDRKVAKLSQLFALYAILNSDIIAAQPIQDLVREGLPEYIASILRSSGHDRATINLSPVARLEDMPMVILQQSTESFTNAVATVKQQSDLLTLISKEINSFTTHVGLPILVSSIAAVKTYAGDERVAALWLAMTLSQTQTSKMENLETTSLDVQSTQQAALNELYDLAVQILAENDTGDWRESALALEIVANQAVISGKDFRVELIDILYPIIYLLGSEIPRLRQHAMVCVNILTKACGYGNAKDLIVENADYLVNAVALRLNIFDVSLQGPQVLLMMVKLAGSSIVPYLEDIVDSIFAILEDYHGYTRLVEVFFSVLKAIGIEGTKEPRLQIQSGQSGDQVDIAIKNGQSSGIEGLVEFITSRKSRKTDIEDLSIPPPDDTISDPIGTNSTDERPDPLPSPKTYPLLLRIAQLTQHYLPSSSPQLRVLLLSLIQDLTPALSRHENSFLPLINTLWPEIVARLDDEEEYILTATFDTMTILCRYAKDFMRTRITDLWNGLDRIEQRLFHGLGEQNKFRRDNTSEQLKNNDRRIVSLGIAVSKSGYVENITIGYWTSLRGFLIAVVTDVGVDEQMFDRALHILRPISQLGHEEIDALRRVNADAVWYELYNEGAIQLEIPDRLRQSKYTWTEVTCV